jgi:hypothetical protein
VQGYGKPAVALRLQSGSSLWRGLCPPARWDAALSSQPGASCTVSVLLHPLIVGSEPIRWRDWSRRAHRRACIQLVRHQCVKVEVEPPTSASLTVKSASLSRAQRAHYRLSWAERLARNARLLTAGRVTIRLFGIPEGFAISLGLATT